MSTFCFVLVGVCSRGRADLIVVMFDAHKLDISDELKMVIDTLKPHHDKMRYSYNGTNSDMLGSV